MKKTWRYWIPVPMKKILKYIYYSFLDVRDIATFKRDLNYPPRRFNFVGSADFKAVGEEFLEHFKTLGGVTPDDRILDIGSGIGRMALPLTSFLKNGSYEGFDIDKRGITWCQQNIAPRYNNFNFQYVDLYNKFYNKAGKTQPQGFVFPYADNSFDFVFATSVFTHLLPADSAHYIDEIKRVLAPGGRVLFTWFALTPESQVAMKNEKSNANFLHGYPGTDFCYYSHATNPEAEIAYTKKWLDNQLGDFEFFAGNWSGQAGRSYQDILVWSPKK